MSIEEFEDALKSKFIQDYNTACKTYTRGGTTRSMQVEYFTLWYEFNDLGLTKEYDACLLSATINRVQATVDDICALGKLIEYANLRYEMVPLPLYVVCKIKTG